MTKSHSRSQFRSRRTRTVNPVFLWARVRAIAWLNLCACASILAVGGLKWRSTTVQSVRVTAPTWAIAPHIRQITPDIRLLSDYTPQLGMRHKFDYQQWVDLLEQEAIVVADQAPDHLDILLGDSITLWFPAELLPRDRVWLNQGISGDTTAGVLDRLPILDRTQPERIFIMVGINDLLQSQSAETILANTRAIVQSLQQSHPDTMIVIQSILPHAGSAATWEGRAKLLGISNQRIETINAELAAIAREFETQYLDLYALFITEAGQLNPALTTDGLHLNQEGYLVWRTALQFVPSATAPAQLAESPFLNPDPATPPPYPPPRM